MATHTHFRILQMVAKHASKRIDDLQKNSSIPLT